VIHMENLLSFFNQNLNHAIGWTVIHSLWQATAVAILSGVVMIVLRKKTAQTRYLVHNVALITVLVSALITFNYYLNSNKNQATDISQVADNQLTATNNDLVSLTLNDAKIKLETTTGVQPETQNPELKTATSLPIVSGSAISIEGMKAYFDAHIYFVVLLWLMGVGLFILKLLGSISYVYYLRSQHNFSVDEYWLDMVGKLSEKVNIKKNIALVESALVRSPVVVGFLKPMILFPIGAINRLNADEVEAILAHEIAHVMRHDYVFNILQSVIEALFYFNPAVWWISANIRAERENCCDDVAIALCGNSMTYAKSLVVVQEMQYYSATFAMGFAGQRKNQLLLRVQRVLNQSNNKSNVMEKLIATCLIVFGFVILSFGGPKNILPDFLDNNDVSTSEMGPLSTNGFWSAEIKGEEVAVSFQQKTATNNWNIMHTFKKSDFTSLPTSESDFAIIREAGKMNFKGKFEGNEGYGKFSFEQNADFASFLSQEGIEGVKESNMIFLFISNINRDYITFLKQNGFKDISKNRLEELAIHGLTKEVLTGYFSSFKKYGKELSLNKLVELKIHGVDAEYQKSLADAGYIDIPLENVIEAKIHGIDGNYLKDLANSGFKAASLQDVIEMKIHGVDGTFIKKMKTATNRELSHEDIVDAKIHGLDNMDIEKFKTTGTDPSPENLRNYAIHGIDADFINMLTSLFGKLEPERIIEAKIHDIDADFVKSYKALGFQNLSFQKAIEFKIHNISADFIASLNEMGYKDLTANKIVELKIHNVSAAYIKAFENIGYKNMPINKLVEFKIHNVTPAMVQSFENIGYKNIEASRLVEMKIHGVTGDFIKSFMDLGFKNVDLDDAVQLKIHQVTPQYIQGMKAKGYKDLDLDEYIRLKIQGFK
jgi:beta-lactamase regulating signal transducer with metallopeptidase domain